MRNAFPILSRFDLKLSIYIHLLKLFVGQSVLKDIDLLVWASGSVVDLRVGIILGFRELGLWELKIKWSLSKQLQIFLEPVYKLVSYFDKLGGNQSLLLLI